MKEQELSWKELGYSVVKGEKACGRNSNGVCVFRESQVTESREMSPEEAELHGYDVQQNLHPPGIG